MVHWTSVPPPPPPYRPPPPPPPPFTPPPAPMPPIPSDPPVAVTAPSGAFAPGRTADALCSAASAGHGIGGSQRGVSVTSVRALALDAADAVGAADPAAAAPGAAPGDQDAVRERSCAAADVGCPSAAGARAAPAVRRRVSTAAPPAPPPFQPPRPRVAPRPSRPDRRRGRERLGRDDRKRHRQSYAEAGGACGSREAARGPGRLDADAAYPRRHDEAPGAAP